jgi:hypothetical protein
MSASRVGASQIGTSVMGVLCGRQLDVSGLKCPIAAAAIAVQIEQQWMPRR